MTTETQAKPAATAQIEYRPVRRIVTGVNAQGQSYIQSDGDTPNVQNQPGKPLAQVLWATGGARAPGDEPAPPGHSFGFHSAGGSLLRVADFPPDSHYDLNALQKFLDENGVRDNSNPRHFWFHKTESLDYAIVLEGEIYAMMDEGEVLMQPGDILIQRATNHSWSNRSDKVCRMAFVLLDLVPDEPL
ncbi:Cupin 2 conserved barrel domain protein [Pseudomonas sp. JV551A1]|uniref:Cupin 2 conserved barrel domain protein n=1 Tax=Pseudomonas inefficax TaxID=2078786 RepID=A0AAQ1PD04_9PSED|nr:MULTISPECIES: cupin domain-containing protein [Pseudomonas]SPO54611.1 Cupin 2 conserved barrel domain protein [Pseudomonas sp. JV551A1]SPO62108.1 Cupin 2 conserved barrel domain protein [Pseudomonas inefficax]